MKENKSPKKDKIKEYLEEDDKRTKEMMDKVNRLLKEDNKENKNDNLFELDNEFGTTFEPIQETYN